MSIQIILNGYSPPRRAAATGCHSEMMRSADTRYLLWAGCFCDYVKKIGNGRTPGIVYLSTLKISKTFRVR